MNLVKKIREKIRAFVKPAPVKRSPEEAREMLQESIIRASQRQQKRMKRPRSGPRVKAGRR